MKKTLHPGLLRGLWGDNAAGIGLGQNPCSFLWVASVHRAQSWNLLITCLRDVNFKSAALPPSGRGRRVLGVGSLSCVKTSFSPQPVRTAPKTE